MLQLKRYTVSNNGYKYKALLIWQGFIYYEFPKLLDSGMQLIVDIVNHTEYEKRALTYILVSSVKQ